MSPHDTIKIDPAYAPILAACGLDSVARVLSRLDGEIAAWSRTTDTLRIHCGEGRPGFFVKRYYYTRWRNRLRSALRGTLVGAHRGAQEFACLQQMRRLGLPAVRPVAVGTRRVGGFVTACFLITEEVPHARNLTSFAQDACAGRRLTQFRGRRRFIRKFAEHVAEMHRAGILHGQLFWRNVLVRFGPDDTPEFYFLDADPPRRWPWQQRAGHIAEELACTLASAAPFTSRAERLRFLLAYLGKSRLDEEARRLARDTGHLAAAHARHESRRIKMNALFDAWSAALAQEQEAGAGSLTGGAG